MLKPFPEGTYNIYRVYGPEPIDKPPFSSKKKPTTNFLVFIICPCPYIWQRGPREGAGEYENMEMEIESGKQLQVQEIYAPNKL